MESRKSQIVNALTAEPKAAAQAEAPLLPPLEPPRSPAVAAILAWLLFGLGHLYLGRVWKGVLLFVLLSATFVTGVVLSHCVFYPTETQAFGKWLGALGAFGYLWAGLHYVGALVLVGAGGDLRAPTYEVGWVAAVAAALLNLLAMLDAWDIAQRRKD
jgi:hypothetical protein